jgi:hypothetical protein
MTHDQHALPPGGDPRPTAYARHGTVDLQGVWSAEDLKAAVDAFLSDLTRFLREQGCSLIGHIKGIVDAGEEGHLFFSVTSFEEKVRFKGELGGAFTRLDFAINVIVYGVGSEGIEKAVLAGLREHLGVVPAKQQ